MKLLRGTIRAIAPLDATAMAKAQKTIGSCLKPPGSLGPPWKTGIEVALAAINEGHDLLRTGEIGIGNTTASAAMLHTFTGAPVERVMGRAIRLKGLASVHRGVCFVEQTFGRNKRERKAEVRIQTAAPIPTGKSCRD